MMLPVCANAVVAAVLGHKRGNAATLCHVSFEWQPPPFPISLLCCDILTTPPCLAG